ncbi:hypothetical protein K474DRAFT_1691959 [Panus rudis PR-1116 ss-1]|nr:hypothetical protein K474DRAFT_1691959 [Panus rudis PR-1116 ss-1]
MSIQKRYHPLAANRAVSQDVLPHELVLSIQRVLEIQGGDDADPFDRFLHEFDSIQIINSYFPDEAALGQLEAVQIRLNDNERLIQHQVNELQEELRRNQDPSRMQLLQEMISDLLGQISRIREKATESEAVVRNITREIQVLDMVKKNLIHSMTTLKRLQMLVNALDQLDSHVKESNYQEIAQTLAAVQQIGDAFKSYRSIGRVSQLWRRIQEIQSELRSKIDAEWEKFYAQDPARPVKPSTMAAACQVIDVLGSDVRSQFLERYVALELKEYRRIFRATDEAGQLDNISRRFAWFRRLLQNHENEMGRVFPAEWKAVWHLTAKFAEITRDDMTVLLSKAGSKLSVKQLLDTLQEVSEFESSIARRYATPFLDILREAQSGSASRPAKAITTAFEPHMGVFIDAQDKALSDMLSQYRGTKSRSSLEATVPTSGDDSSTPVLVLPSSTELFYFYAQTLDQCAKMFTGQPLFDLCALFKKWLRIYAEDVLVASMKKPNGTMPRRSIETRFDGTEVRNACTLINTADYCHYTAQELEQKISEKIDPEFKEKVSLQEECDLFVSVVSSAIQVLAREFETACEPALNNMRRTTWSNLSLVSGQSAYVDELVQAMEQVSEMVKPLIEQKKYLRNYFDKVSGMVLAKFTTSLVKSRPLKEIGAEQLLIDLQAIKASLLKLPGEELVTSNYTRSVMKNTARLESLLKVIVTPIDPAEGFILNYTLLIGDASFTNFQKILDLKGTPPTQQNDLMDTFLTVTSTKTELESTSFLSSLDMDPDQATIPVASTINRAGAGEGIFAALSSPPLSTPTTGSETPSRPDHASKFTDFRRFVSFAVRRDSAQP